MARSEVALPADEPFLVTAARQVWAGQRSHEQFHAVFGETTVYAERTQQPGVLVWDAGERGRWTVVFSQLQRLAAHAGACSYLPESHLPPWDGGISHWLNGISKPRPQRMS